MIFGLRSYPNLRDASKQSESQQPRRHRKCGKERHDVRFSRATGLLAGAPGFAFCEHALDNGSPDHVKTCRSPRVYLLRP